MTTISFYTLAGTVVADREARDIQVPNIAGYICQAGADLVALYAAASVRYSVPAALLLAQGAQESAFVAGKVSGDGGYGIAQFTDEGVARQFLGIPAPGDWHAAAMDPAQAIPAQASFMALLHGQQGSWSGACGAYNGGPNWQGKSDSYAAGVPARAVVAEQSLMAFPAATPAFIPHYAHLKSAAAIKPTPDHTSAAVIDVPALAGVEVRSAPIQAQGEQWVKVLYGAHGTAYTGYVPAANVGA